MYVFFFNNVLLLCLPFRFCFEDEYCFFFPSHLFLFSILEFSRTTLTLRSTEVKVI